MAGKLLALDRDDEDHERQFHLDYLRSLSTEERFRMVIDISNHMARTLLEHGHRKPFEIIKRS